MINQLTVDVSVASALVIAKEVPATIVDTYTACGAVTVPRLATVKNIFDAAVTFVFATVTVPATKVAVPMLLVAVFTAEI